MLMPLAVANSDLPACLSSHCRLRSMSLGADESTRLPISAVEVRDFG